MVDSREIFYKSVAVRENIIRKYYTSYKVWLKYENAIHKIVICKIQMLLTAAGKVIALVQPHQEPAQCISAPTTSRKRPLQHSGADVPARKCFLFSSGDSSLFLKSL